MLATRDHAAGRTLYPLTDSLGSPLAITDSAAAVQATFTYAAFGATRTKTGSADTRFRFTGRELDPESGLMHYRARAYDPAVGRFLQPDPLPRTPADPRMLGMSYLGRLAAIGHPLPGAVPGSLSGGLPERGMSFQVGLLQNPLGLNVYPYVLNNPTGWTDPLGLEGKRFRGAGRAFLIGFGVAASAEMFHMGEVMISTGNPVGVAGGLIAIVAGGLLLYIIGSG